MNPNLQIRLFGFHTIHYFHWKYWPAHPDDPQRSRVASVFKLFDCLSVCLRVLCLWTNFLHFIHPRARFIAFHLFQILKYLRWIHFTPPGITVQYSTVQYSTVHYSTVQYILERASNVRLPLVMFQFKRSNYPLKVGSTMQSLHIHGEFVTVKGIKQTSLLEYINAWKSFKDYLD